jgi:hypothetical protein
MDAQRETSEAMRLALSLLTAYSKHDEGAMHLVLQDVSAFVRGNVNRLSTYALASAMVSNMALANAALESAQPEHHNIQAQLRLLASAIAPNFPDATL